MPRTSKRVRVLECLREAGKAGLTVAELAEEGEMSKLTARTHLATLMGSGDVCRERMESDGLPGQPPYVYLLAGTRPVAD